MRIRAFIAGMAALFVSTGLLADDYDGTQPLVCFTKHAFSCVSGGDCLESTEEEVNMPEFFKVNFAAKTVTAKRLDGSRNTTSIDKVEENEGELILHGTENGLGWSAAITQDSGKLALSAVGDRVAFVVFGVCSPV